MTGPEESGSHPTAPHRPDACCSHLGYGLGSSPLSISQFEFSTRSPVLLFPPPPYFPTCSTPSWPPRLCPPGGGRGLDRSAPRSGWGTAGTRSTCRGGRRRTRRLRLLLCWGEEKGAGRPPPSSSLQAGRRTTHANPCSLFFPADCAEHGQCGAVGLSNLRPLCAFPGAAAAPLPAPAHHCPVSVPYLG